jgi:hypothetical protein
MEFFNNLTSASAGSMVMKPLIETGTAIAINIPTPIPTPRPKPRPTPIPTPRPINPITPPIDEIIEKNEQIDAYFGGGGGFGFGEEEVAPETTEVVEKKSNVGKTLLILTGLGLAFMLLAGGKKSKVK